MLNQLKSMIKSPSFYGILVFIFLVIQPLVDLDYLLNDFLKQYHLIVPSTIVRFLILPLLAVGAFILVDKHKKRTFIGAAIIAIIWIAYVVLHFISTKNLDLFLPANYQFLTGIELKYILTMTLPFVLMYVVWMANFSEKSFNRVILCVSTFVCGVIFITDLLAISKGSYGGYTQSSFISWFMGGYEQYKATQLTSKGFFQEANVIGALLFTLLPLLYKVLYEVKRKWPVMILIVIHSLCMMIVGTRVATLGTIAVAVIAFIGYLIILLLKQGRLQVVSLAFMAFMIAFCSLVFPYSPAIKHQQENAVQIQSNREDNQVIPDLSSGLEGMEGDSFEYNWALINIVRNNAWLENAVQIQSNREDNQVIPDLSSGLEGMEGDSFEYNWALINIVRNNAWLIGMPAYYDYIYEIEFDPVFWKHVLEQPFEVRTDGRDLQKLFAEYKWDMLTPKQKLFGTSYSTVSQGGFIIEQDFLRQYYTLGILGAIIFTGPYLVLTAACGVNMLRRFKSMVTFENGMLLVSVGAGLGAAYYSGHVLDTLLTSFFIAFSLITLFQKTLKKVD